MYAPPPQQTVWNWIWQKWIYGLWEYIADTTGKKTSITLASGATTFARTSTFMVVTGDAGANTIGTITSGQEAQELTLLFVDGLVTVTDTAGHTADTVDLSASFTSADDAILKLIYDGTSWYEVSRSVN